MVRRNTGNHTAYWQNQRIPGMSLLRADFTTHEYGPHTHDAFVIAVTEAGVAEIQSRGIAEKVGPCTLFVSNPEERQDREGLCGRLFGATCWNVRRQLRASELRRA